MATGNVPAAARAKFSGLPFPVSFVDVARDAGLTAKFVLGRSDRKQYIVEANGMGVAFLDYNQDGRLDIFLVNGSRFEPFAKGQEPTNHLYRNQGAGKFSDATREAGVARSGWGNGVCAGDFDGDGREDLYVTYRGPNSLYRSQGGGSFEDVAARAGVAGPSEEWSTGCTFLDYDRDGRLDLFVTSYVAFDLKTVPRPGEQAYCLFKDAPVYCGPRGLPFGTVTLYHNRGGGRFEDVSAASGMRKPGGFYAFTAAAADLNGDGWVDIYVACDSTPGLYFRNNRDGTFTELATEAGIAYNEHGAEQAGMGIAIADYNNDGWLDITKTNFIRDYPNVYRNLGKGLYEDAVVAAGLAVNPHYVLWGTALEDFDNDGWRDIFQVGGHVYPEIQKIDPEESYANPRLVYRNLGSGRFEDVSRLAGPGVAARHSSRGAAFGDFDNDGDLDVLVMNMDEPPSLLRNDLKSSHRWLKVKLQGTKSNRSGIGSTVVVHAGGRVQAAPLLSQSSYLSVNDPRLHFGLGAARAADKIVVRWASGAVEEFPGPPANALVLLVEGSREVKILSWPQ
ncbi:MAG: CRTAC1 family protein [Acidobacteria bacterium]|nr:CRTAC1 family protein [Acidobacteriota bacterium]MBI3278837.1 CRTAC1 family protein [Acidobacteriota bacterium]